jgi:hypothetical protein
VLGVSLWAQIGGGGIPIPSIGHKKKNQSSSTSPAQQTIAADGLVVTNDGKALIVATEDGRTLTLKLNPETKFTRKAGSIQGSAVVPRATVHVEASVDDEGYLTGLTVDVTKDAPANVPGARAGVPGAARSQDDESDSVRPTILNSPVDAPDRPVLRHGIPKKPTSADDDTPEVATASAPAKQVSAPAPEPVKESGEFTITGDAPPPKASSANSGLIGKSKTWAESFMVGLPNFVCQQFTTRYVEVSKSAGWQPQDVLTATVVYDDGKESYRDITIGGHKTSKSMRELGGSTSTGEFASTLRSLFADYSQTDFKLYQSTTIGQTAATIYDFKVALKNSDWTITIGGQSLRPAYTGSIWIDRSTAAVRRIEMEAKNIPQDFPFDTVQWAVDYDYVNLGESKFLLPVHAENLGCQRGSSFCSKNTIDFRNYHRYSGESTITFGQ